MQALTNHGGKDVRVETVPDPVLAAEDEVQPLRTVSGAGNEHCATDT